MEAAGFSNVYDALQNLSMSAGVAGEQSANSSQTAGQQINIRGLGPSRALTLINGRRVTDNPTASYNGGSFFDYSLIPLAAVERVEVLTGGGSAVYGSDAVAGVINVILKKDVTDTTIRLTHGQATAGGDVTNKIQLVGGFQTDSASLTYALEYQDEGGLNAKDIDRLDSLDDNPNGFNGRPNSQAWHYIYGRTFVSPTDEECESVAPGSKSLPYGPGFDGNVCGSIEADNYSIKNPRERMNAMVNFSMDLTDDVELFGTAIAWGSKTNNQIFRKWMQAVEVDPNTGNYSNQLITFAQDEFPASSFNEKETYVGMFGARGTLLEDYDWELGFNLSNTSEYSFAQQFKQKAVTEWVNLTNYNPFVRVTAADFSDDAIGNRWTDATSESRSVDFQITGALMELDAGPVQFSTILEYKFDEYEIKVDEIATQGHIVDGGWTNGSANFGAGDRERFSAGIEFLVPLTDQIEVGFATRYDSYHDKSEVGGRPTSQINIAYRPTDSLLLRASAAQSFRAPDKHYLFKERQDSYYNSGVTDVYTCRSDGTEADFTAGCLDYNSNTLSGYTARYQGQGNPNLKEENGENISIGMAYEFSENANITIDYWNIKIENEIIEETASSILTGEANCRLGSNQSGNESFDINSDECQRFISQVVRDEDGYIDEVKPGYVNRTSSEMAGWDFKGDYKLETESIGDFNFGFGYTITTKRERTNADVTEDIRDLDGSARNSRSNLSFQTSWIYDDFYAQLTFYRTGSIMRADCFRGGFEEDGTTEAYDDNEVCNDLKDDGSNLYKRLDALWTTNLTAGYSFMDDHNVTLSVSNLLDNLGRADKTDSSWPWRNTTHYSLRGRYASLRYSYRF
jgi:outer membrane receptor protein involved in Fe transport